MNVVKMRLNSNVLAGPAALGVGIYLVAPELASAALPYLVLVIYPNIDAVDDAGNWDAGGGPRESQCIADGLTRE